MGSKNTSRRKRSKKSVNSRGRTKKNLKPKISPYRNYSRAESDDDFRALESYIKNTPAKLPFKRSRLGYTSSNKFFQRSRMNTAGSDKKDSCAKKWRQKSPELIKKWTSYQRRSKTKKDLSGFLIYLNKAPAQFPPSIAGMIYKHFDATHVLDPFAGWGDRCIAAMAAGINYTGIDSNTSLKPVYKRMINSYWPDNTKIMSRTPKLPSKLSFTSPDSTQKINLYFKPCQDIDISKIQYDLVFSSPPFWKNGKLVEKYPQCEQNYETFMTDCMIPMMNKFKEKNVITCLHIPEHMYKDLTEQFGTSDKKINFSSGKWGKSSGSPNNTIYCWKWTK